MSCWGVGRFRYQVKVGTGFTQTNGLGERGKVSDYATNLTLVLFISSDVRCSTQANGHSGIEWRIKACAEWGGFLDEWIDSSH